MKLSVIIPAYNEEHTIAQVIAKVQAVRLQSGMEREIIVVNDGSTDGTAQALKAVSPDIKVVHQSNQGKTAALVRGFQESNGDIILVQDADLEYDPQNYPVLLEPLINGSALAVYGSRFLGTIEGMAPINRWANLISNWTFSALFGFKITDINTCYKVFARGAIRDIPITSRNFAFETEVTVKLLRKGIKIKEVPIHYSARSRKQGKKIKWSTALEMFWPILKYRFCRGN